ncbi:cysteine peptidase family C39 domain-containing protein, partial [Pseudomonas sp. F1002]
MNIKNFQLIRQQEQSECGLACVAMICEHYGVDISLNSLRADFATGGRGINLKNLSDLLSKIGFRYRHLRLELEQVRTLELPCILHWRM